MPRLFVVPYADSLQSRQPSNTMAAADAVLGTFELVENILVHLSLTDAVRSTRTAKLWRNASHESPRLHQRLHTPQSPLRSIESPFRGVGNQLWTVDACSLLYEMKVIYALSDVLAWPHVSSQRFPTKLGVRGRFYLEISKEVEDKLQSSLDLFATKPPIQALLVHVGLHYCRHILCTTYVPTGIRVRDMLQVPAAAARSHLMNDYGNLMRGIPSSGYDYEFARFYADTAIDTTEKMDGPWNWESDDEEDTYTVDPDLSLD